MRVAIVQGTRPEIIKNYSVVKALQAADVSHQVLHTNQHCDPSMCQNIYRDMDYKPTQTMPRAYRLGTAIDWLQERFRDDGITHVIVNGDTAASLAGALAAMYLDIGVSHIEAGLRSNDPNMLEERNRIIVDAIAQRLFAYTHVELDALRRMPGIRGSLHLVGNTTVDVLHDFRESFRHPVRAGRYVYVTMHRKEFTDSPERMESVFGVLRELAADHCDVVLPLHPRTRDVLQRTGMLSRCFSGISVIEPVSIFESLALQKHAAAVLTDSGCIQEEAYLLGVPCVTLRENTERQLTVHNGANVVAGFSPDRIRASAIQALLAENRARPGIYGLPGVGARIVKLLLEPGVTLSPVDELAYA